MRNSTKVHFAICLLKNGVSPYLLLCFSKSIYYVISWSYINESNLSYIIRLNIFFSKGKKWMNTVELVKFYYNRIALKRHINYFVLGVWQQTNLDKIFLKVRQRSILFLASFQRRKWLMFLKWWDFLD